MVSEGIFSKSVTVDVLNVVVVDDVVVAVVVVVIGAVVDVFAVLVGDSERSPSSIMNSVVVVVTGINFGFSSSISFSSLLLIPNISKMSFIILTSLFEDSSSAISVGSSFSSSPSSQTTFVIFLLTFLGIFSTICSHSSCGMISQFSDCWGSQTNSCCSLQTSD